MEINMIKVLHIMSSIGTAGGVQGLIWNYYKHIDEEKVCFDFAVFNGEMNGFEKNFQKKGSKIYVVTPKRKSIRKHYTELKNAIKSDNYDIIHVHQDYLGYLTLFIAWKCGIKNRIIHTHKANLKETAFQKIKRLVLTKLTCLFATDYFACGTDSAKWTFGEKIYNRAYILNNAIEIMQYTYNSDIRNDVRTTLRLDDKIVIGNIARFTYQKNHELLIEVFESLYKKNTDYRLMLVGDGENLEKIQNMIKEKNLQNAVLMLGSRNDCNRLFQAMDVFVLTSRFEGLPITLVEAQCSGLCCVAAHNITREVNVTGKVSYIENDDDLDEWIDKIDSLKNEKHFTDIRALSESGFDILAEANKLTEQYTEIMLKKKQLVKGDHQ